MRVEPSATAAAGAKAAHKRHVERIGRRDFERAVVVASLRRADLPCLPTVSRHPEEARAGSLVHAAQIAALSAGRRELHIGKHTTADLGPASARGIAGSSVGVALGVEIVIVAEIETDVLDVCEDVFDSPRSRVTRAVVPTMVSANSAASALSNNFRPARGRIYGRCGGRAWGKSGSISRSSSGAIVAWRGGFSRFTSALPFEYRATWLSARPVYQLVRFLATPFRRKKAIWAGY